MNEMTRNESCRKDSKRLNGALDRLFSEAEGFRASFQFRVVAGRQTFNLPSEKHSTNHLRPSLHPNQLETSAPTRRPIIPIMARGTTGSLILSPNGPQRQTCTVIRIGSRDFDEDQPSSRGSTSSHLISFPRRDPGWVTKASNLKSQKGGMCSWLLPYPMPAS